jgi:hypothetical protein
MESSRDSLKSKVFVTSASETRTVAHRVPLWEWVRHGAEPKFKLTLIASYFQTETEL